MLTLAFNIQPVKAEPKTWYVDDDGGADFTKIQDAIYAASSGDTIYVYNGTYYEHIYISKSLTLIGENKYGTIIDGSGYGPIVEIYASYTNFTSFTVRNAGWTYWERDNGIRLRRTQSSQVTDCIVLGCAYGIREIREWGLGGKNLIIGNTVSDCTEIAIGSSHESSIGNIVANNTITNSSTGIYFNYPYNIQVIGNTISNMTGEVRYGIHFQVGGSNNTVVGNTVMGYTDYGIAIRYADKNLVSENTLSNNFYGIELSQSSSDNTVTGNDVSNNGVGISIFDNSNNNLIAMNNFLDSVPVGFYISDIGIWVGSSHENIIHYNNISNNGNGVYLYSSSNNNVSSNNITDNWTGIQSIYSSSNDIIGNNIAYNECGISLVQSSSNVSLNDIANNKFGIVLQSSSSNIILGNNIKTNKWYGVNLYDSSYNTFSGNNITNNGNGIWMDWSSKNTFDGNHIEGNQEYGIWLALSSDNNTVTHNSITANEYGIGLEECSGNTIYHNNFINNVMQAGVSLPHVNTWDDGYPSGGNYWSDYTGVDADGDGIGDIPYVIDADNQDRYPLINPWGAGSPAASFSWSPSTPEVNEPVTFDASASMPIGGEIVSYEWDFGDGEHASGMVVTHQYGSAGDYTVTLNVTDSEGLWDIEQKQIEVKAPPPPLTVSISPTSASILVGQSVTFTSTVSGGYTPYSYQWYLNGNPVSGATSASWTFTPTASGIYYVHLKVTDAKGNTAQSETARITVATVPVGGYSVPIQGYSTAKPLTPYLTLIAILTIALATIKRKTPRKTKKPP
jgi:parallel beta-helix repeat protein